MLSEIVRGHRVVVCAGAGGSGKTTIAAALGLLAARDGARAVVVTIDPARRLADALGLAELKSTPDRVAVDAPGGLWAMMLDQKPAWDRMIARRAGSPERRDAFLANTFYQRFSREFAGAHAYAAIDTLCELSGGAEFDTIILDTPPIRWAVDFFRAPSNVIRLLEDSAFGRALDRYQAVRDGTGGRAAAWVVARLEAATGARALEEARAFLGGLAEMKGAFLERAEAMEALLASERLTSILIATPDARALEEGGRYLTSAAELGVETSAVVFNRTALALVPADAAPRVARELTEAGLDRAASAWVEANFARYRERAEGERERIARFLETRPALASILLPELEGDVHDLSGLERLRRLLADGGSNEVTDPQPAGGVGHASVRFDSHLNAR